MSRGLTLPETEREIERLKNRVSDLERQLRRLVETIKPEGVYSLSGPIYATTSGRWKSRPGGLLADVLFMLDTPGTTATELELILNGEVLRSVTIPAGIEEVVVAPQVRMGADSDYLQVRVVTAGTGASDLTVQARVR